MTIESVKLNMPMRYLRSKAINAWSDGLTIITRRSRYRADVICVTLGEG